MKKFVLIVVMALFCVFTGTATATPYPTLKAITVETHRLLGDRGAYYHVLLRMTRCRSDIAYPARHIKCRFVFVRYETDTRFTRYGKIDLIRRKQPAKNLIDFYDELGSWFGAGGWYRVAGRQFNLTMML